MYSNSLALLKIFFVKVYGMINFWDCFRSHSHSEDHLRATYVDNLHNNEASFQA